MVNQSVKYTLFFSLLISVLYWALTGDSKAFGLFVGSAWGCANLYLLSEVANSILMTKNVLMIGVKLTIKFPIFYGIGYLILQAHWWDPLVLLIGFSMIFIGIVLSFSHELNRRSV